MTGGYPDANKNGVANAYGILGARRGRFEADMLEFLRPGRKQTKRAVFDPAVQDVDTSAIDDCATKPQ